MVLPQFRFLIFEGLLLTGRRNLEAQLASVANASTKPESQGLKAGCSAAPNRHNHLAASWMSMVVRRIASCQSECKACWNTSAFGLKMWLGLQTAKYLWCLLLSWIRRLLLEKNPSCACLCRWRSSCVWCWVKARSAFSRSRDGCDYCQNSLFHWINLDLGPDDVTRTGGGQAIGSSEL